MVLLILPPIPNTLKDEMPRDFVIEALLSKPYHAALEVSLKSFTYLRNLIPLIWVFKLLEDLYFSLRSSTLLWMYYSINSYWWLTNDEGQRATTVESSGYFTQSHSLNICYEQGMATLAQHGWQGQERGLERHADLDWSLCLNCL